MEKIIKMVSEKAGIPEDKAKTAVETVVNYLKEKLPGGMAGQIDTFLKSDISPENTLADSTKGHLGSIF